MKSFLLNTLDDIRTSYWFIPAIMAVGAIVLSFCAIQFDASLDGQGPDWMSWLFDNQPEGAREVLSTLAGSMVTVAGVVFSITLVTVSNAAFQFGPRLLTTFMRDRANQVTLGTFIATFLYCLMVLRAVQSVPASASDESASSFVPHVALLGALALAICSIAVLIYFIHHVPRSIHVSRIVAQIGEELCQRLDDRFPIALGEAAHKRPDDKACETFRKTVLTASKSQPVVTSQTGYIRVIDADSLIETAKEQKLQIVLLRHPGDFVAKGDELMRVLGSHDEVGEDVLDDLSDTISVGAMRTQLQDIEFLSQELAEIAMRALSPGINDPVTAITAMNWLGAGIGLLGQREPLSPLRMDDEDKPRVFSPTVGLPELLRASLGSIVPFAARNVVAGRSYIRVLDEIRGRLDERFVPYLEKQRQEFFEIAEAELSRQELDSLKTLARITEESKEGGEAGWRKRLRQTVLRK